MLACLLLQKIFTLNVTSNFLRYTCTTLGLLCRRSELRRSIFAILKENMAKIKDTHSLHLLILISSMGIDAVTEFFIPFIDDYFNSCQENFDVKFELLVYTIDVVLCIQLIKFGYFLGYLQCNL